MFCFQIEAGFQKVPKTFLDKGHLEGQWDQSVYDLLRVSVISLCLEGR